MAQRIKAINIRNKLRNWLGVSGELEDFQKAQNKVVDTLERDLEYWHRTFRSFSVVPCAYCKKQMHIYPYGGAYYHIEDNRKVHAGCYDKYLKEQK